MTARIDLVDLSHWNPGEMDFAAAKAAGLKGVIHKATEGVTVVDPLYAQRRQEVAAAGLKFGGTHFAHTEDDPAAQAAYFLSIAAPMSGDLWPTLDLEQNLAKLNPTDLTAFVGKFVHTIRKATGSGTVIYTTFNLTEHFDCPLWVARYSDAMLPPVVRTPWNNWHIWQFSNGDYPHTPPGNGPNSIAGIGHCDLDTIAGDKPDDFLTRITIA